MWCVRKTHSPENTTSLVWLTRQAYTVHLFSFIPVCFFKKVSFALIVQEYKGELEKQLGLSWPLDLHSDEKLVMVYEEEQVLHCLEN